MKDGARTLLLPHERQRGNVCKKPLKDTKMPANHWFCIISRFLLFFLIKLQWKKKELLNRRLWKDVTTKCARKEWSFKDIYILLTTSNSLHFVSFHVCLLVSFYHILGLILGSWMSNFNLQRHQVGSNDISVHTPELECICFQLKASLRAFNWTLVASSTHEVDNTICSVSAQEDLKKRRIYSVLWRSVDATFLGEMEHTFYSLFFVFVCCVV